MVQSRRSWEVVVLNMVCLLKVPPASSLGSSELALGPLNPPPPRVEAGGCGGALLRHGTRNWRDRVRSQHWRRTAGGVCHRGGGGGKLALSPAYSTGRACDASGPACAGPGRGMSVDMVHAPPPPPPKGAPVSGAGDGGLGGLVNRDMSLYIFTYIQRATVGNCWFQRCCDAQRASRLLFL